MRRKLNWKDALWSLFLVTVVAVILVNPSWNRPYQEIQETGTLRVLTRNAPTTYFVDATGTGTGPEYDLVQAFVTHMGWKAEFIVKATLGELLDALRAGEGDLVAAGVSGTHFTKGVFDTGPEYQRVAQQVVCRRDGKLPRTVAQLEGKNLWVVHGTSYEEQLKRLRKTYTALNWTTTRELATEQVLEMVWKGQADCTVADSTIIKINRRYFPELEIAFDLKESEPLTWIIPAASQGLKSDIQKWFSVFQEAGGPKAVQARYYDFLPEFDYVNTRRFMRHIEARLPRFRDWFERAAHQYNLSPVMLAAQAYQESKWNPSARSPTDVKGIMMLTRATAASMGIKNRLDVPKSIYGGAMYMARLKENLSDIPEPDRTWMALAAYNVGLGHLRDAQELARQEGKNPKKWRELKTVLPLLRNKKYYKKLKYGYARGLEPVRYVQRIREYAGILARKLKEEAGLEP